MEHINIFDQNIKNFLEELKKIDVSFVSPDRKTRRDPDGPLIKNVEKKEFPIFEEIKKKNIFLNEEILFLGFMWNSTHTLFDMERLLLPLYFSFYLEKPVYIYLEPKYFKVDYLNGVTKILNETLIPKFTVTLSKSSSLDTYKNSKNTKNIVLAPITVNKNISNANLILPNNYMFKCVDPFFCEEYKKNRKNDLNIILFLGTLIDEKGQYLFLQNVNVEIIKDYTILLIGKNRKHTFKQCIDLAKKRNISLICFPYIHHNLLYNIIPRCKYQICYCCEAWKVNLPWTKIIGDCNPRSITEGLFAGLPYLVSDWCDTPEIMKSEKLGVICRNNDTKSLNDNLNKLLKINNNLMFNYVEENFNYNNYLEWLINDIYNKYIINI